MGAIYDIIGESKYEDIRKKVLGVRSTQEDKYMKWLSEKGTEVSGILEIFHDSLNKFNSSETNIGLIQVPVCMYGWYNPPFDYNDKHYLGWYLSTHIFQFWCLIGRYNELKSVVNRRTPLFFRKLSQFKTGETYKKEDLGEVNDNHDTVWFEKSHSESKVIEDDLIPISSNKYYSSYFYKKTNFVISPLIPLSYFHSIFENRFDTNLWELLR